MIDTLTNIRNMKGGMTHLCSLKMAEKCVKPHLAQARYEPELIGIEQSMNQNYHNTISAAARVH